VHVDRPRTQEQVAADLLVRAADRDLSDDFELAAREASGLDVVHSSPAQAALDRLAEHRQGLGGALRERPRVKLAGGAIGLDLALDGLVALAGRRQGLTQTKLRHCALIQRKVLTPNDYTSLGELAEAIDAFGKRYSALGKLFAWCFTRQDLERRLREPLLQSGPLTLSAAA